MRFGRIEENGAEDNPDDEDIVEAGRYYLYNVEAGMYLTAANSWGTRASLDADGLEVDIQPYGEGYSIDTQVSNGGDSHYLNISGSIFCDQPVGCWQIKKQADGSYTLSLDGSSFLAYDGTTASSFSTNKDEQSAHWHLVKQEERMAELRQATAGSPKDATFLIQGANFSRNDLRNQAWNGKPTIGGKVENMCGEKFNTTFDVSQTLVDIPNGRYRVSFQGFYREGGDGPAINEALRQNGQEHLYASFYANQNAVPLMSIFEEAGQIEGVGRETAFGKVPNTMSDASAFFSQGLYQTETDIVVTDGTLRLGFCKDVHVGRDWTCFDNVRLSYLGEAAAVRGDINGDGKLTAEDVAALIRICLGKTLPGYAEGYGDLNGDGRVTLADVTCLVNLYRQQQ